MNPSDKKSVKAVYNNYAKKLYTGIKHGTKNKNGLL